MTLLHISRTEAFAHKAAHYQEIKKTMTAQTPDSIELVDQKTFGYCGYIPVPARHPMIGSVDDHGEYVTSNVAGYTAGWKLEQGELFLVSLDGNKRLLAHAPVLADWLTECCFINFGEPIDWFLDELVTDRCLALQVERGRVQRWAIWSYDDPAGGIDDAVSSRSIFRKRFEDGQ